MCGIIAGFNTTPKSKNKKNKTEKINDFIINQYQDQCNRGTKGFGIIRIDEGGKIELDRATEEVKFLLDLYLKPAKMIIAHHRQPTSSENKMSQTHPIAISNKMLKYDYLFVHNGVISNDTKLKEKHEKMGFKYTTEHIKEGYWQNAAPVVKFNDSEALGVEVALFIENKQEYVDTDNQAAFITLQIDKKTKKATNVFFGRNGKGSVLNLAKIQGNIKISSEGEGEEVLENTLWSFDPKDDKMKLTSRNMIFKENKPVKDDKDMYNVQNFGRHVHQNPLPTNITTTDKTVEGTKLTEKVPTPTKEAELITIEERIWMRDKTVEDNTNYEDDADIFIDQKNYLIEEVDAYKQSIKEDDSDMIESSLDMATDDQVEKIGKMIELFAKTVKNRKIDKTERGFYLGQIYHVLRTMEAIADISEEEFSDKLIAEDLKAQEEAAENSVGFRVPKKHGNMTDDYQNATGVMDFERFG